MAPIFVILAAVFWGGLFIFVRAFSNAGFSSAEIVFLRCLSSAFWLFLYVYATERKNRSADGSPAMRLKISDIWCFAGAGLISIVFFSWCYFKNVAVTSAAFASVLMYTSPIFVMLLSALLFKEPLTRIKLGILVIAILGTSLICGIFNNTTTIKFSFEGILLGLGSGIGYALYSIFGTMALIRGYRPLVVTFYTFIFAACGSMFLIDLPPLFAKLIAGGLFPLAFAMGLFGSCLPFALYTIGLSRMESGRAAVLATLEPIVSAVLGIIIYGEVLSISEITGIVLVLSAGILTVKLPKPKTH